MPKNPQTLESFDASQIRRHIARKVLGLGNTEPKSTAEDHAEVCRMLADSGFVPEAEFTSAAGVLCGTGAAAIDLSNELSQTLAKAELDHFASRYFFYEPEQRSELWTQLTDTVAPYPALAWRHLHLKAGLNVPRDVLRSLEDHIGLAAAIIQWYIQSPLTAANDVRKYVFQAAENSRTTGTFWTDWFEVQQKASLVSVLIPSGVVAVQTRMHWLSESKLIPNAGLIAEAPVKVKPSRSRWIPRLNMTQVCAIVFITLLLLPQLIQTLERIGIPVHFSQNTSPSAESLNTASSPVVSKPLELEVKVSPNPAVRDFERGEKVIDLFHYIGTIRRIAESSKHPVIIYYSSNIRQQVDDVQLLMSGHAQADFVGHRSDQTTGDAAVIFPESLSRFYCVGFARIDDQQKIRTAFWKNQEAVLDREDAEMIVRSLHGRLPVDEARRRELQLELEALTKMKVFVLTPDEFLATFDSPAQVDSDTVKSELKSSEQVSPTPATPQD